MQVKTVGCVDDYNKNTRKHGSCRTSEASTALVVDIADLMGVCVCGRPLYI